MPDECIRRRLLFACREAYQDDDPVEGGPVGWAAAPRLPVSITDPADPEQIDKALVGRIDEGIVVALRGTVAPFIFDDAHGSGKVLKDWINNGKFLSRDNRFYPGRVHRGFAESVEALWPRLRPAIEALIQPGGKNTLFVTGHSKGGALANLVAWRALAIGGLDGPIRVCTIAAARAGNTDFRTAYEAHGGIRCVRYEVALDLVPYVPPGADLPVWAKPVLLKFGAGIGANNYVGVGRQVVTGGGWRDMLGALGGYIGLSLQKRDVRELAGAHDIGERSAYDQMICDRDPGGCGHD